MKHQFNYTIIGAGIIGLAIAERLSREYKNILIIEKEKYFGLHTSSRNSEVIHSGFYYPKDSLKAKLCVQGNQMIYDFCNKYKISYNRCGKLVVANDSQEIDKLSKILNIAKENGVKGIKLLSSKESQSIEPQVRAKSAIWIPSTGIMDVHKIMSKLESLSLSRDVSIAYNIKLKDINKVKNLYALQFHDDTSTVYTENIINCSGLWSHKIANKILNENKYEIEYYKGDYFKTTQIQNMNCLIYPIPSKLSLGVHAILNLNGEVFFGPNIYKVNAIEYSTTNKFKKFFLQSANNLLSFKIDNIYRDYSGIRPKLKNGNDFIITEEPSLKNFYNLIGIDSPGLTSSLAIADFVYQLTKN